MQSTLNELIGQIEDLTKSAVMFEFKVLFKCDGIISECKINSAGGSTKVLLRNQNGGSYSEDKADSLVDAFNALVKICGNGKIFIDTLAVRTSDAEYLKHNDKLYLATRAALISDSPERIQYSTADLKSEVVKMMDEQLRSFDKFQTSIWLKSGDWIREGEINTYWGTVGKDGVMRGLILPGYLHVCVRYNPYAIDGMHYHAANAECAAAALSHFLEESDELLLNTFVVKTNSIEGNAVADKFLGVSDPLHVLTRQFWFNCIARKDVPPVDGTNPHQMRGAMFDNVLLNSLTSGKDGVNLWNQMPGWLKDRLQLEQLQLQKHDLSGIKFDARRFNDTDFSESKMKKFEARGTDLTNCSFRNADLSQSEFPEALAPGADFSSANLQKAKFTQTNLCGANFRDADISGAQFKAANLCGVDLTSSKFSTPPVLSQIKYDDGSKLPVSIPEMKDFVWCGQGPDPYKTNLMQILSQNNLDFAGFMDLIDTSYDHSRISKSISMLKKERFQLFVEQDASGVIGIVKSQTDIDLVYASKLGANGTFSCCTQNLNSCGGLRGALCKHILVLVIGLVKAGQLDPNDAANRMIASLQKKPKLDKNLMTNVFLRYKGVECGEIDWRPTETIPEDYYAF